MHVGAMLLGEIPEEVYVSLNKLNPRTSISLDGLLRNEIVRDTMSISQRGKLLKSERIMTLDVI